MAFGWRLIRIDGASMAPLLEPGDFALVRLIPPGRAARDGEVVLATHVRYGRIVKRVAGRTPAGELRIEGVSAASTPAVDLGALPETAVLGRLVCRIGRHGVSRLRAPRDLSAPAAPR